jgi:hypothetical protein
MEVDKFKDFFLSEKMYWHKAWKEIDLELDLKNITADKTNTKDRIVEVQELLDTDCLIDERLWPSAKISRTVVESMIKYIWETFLSDKAEFQICIPSRVLWNTMRRMRHAHLYGKEVFHEALFDPIKTIFRDIYPRFRNSDHMRALRQRMKEIEILPPSSELHLPPLPIVIPKRYTIRELQDGAALTLDDMLEDRICFREFFRYLQSCIVSENMRFVRALHVYKSLIDSRDKGVHQQGVEWAWRIYKFFVAAYSAYEISVADKTRREVMRHLADPNINIFDPLERSTMDILKAHFATYRTKKEYAALNHIILDSMEFQGDHSGAPTKSNQQAWGCFGIM